MSKQNCFKTPPQIIMWLITTFSLTFRVPWYSSFKCTEGDRKVHNNSLPKNCHAWNNSKIAKQQWWHLPDVLVFPSEPHPHPLNYHEYAHGQTKIKSFCGCFDFEKQNIYRGLKINHCFASGMCGNFSFAWVSFNFVFDFVWRPEYPELSWKSARNAIRQTTKQGTFFIVLSIYVYFIWFVVNLVGIVKSRWKFSNIHENSQLFTLTRFKLWQIVRVLINLWNYWFDWNKINLHW